MKQILDLLKESNYLRADYEPETFEELETIKVEPLQSKLNVSEEPVDNNLLVTVEPMEETFDCDRQAIDVTDKNSDDDLKSNKEVLKSLARDADLEVKEGDKVECKFCNALVSKDYLYRHEKKHTDPIVCSICKKCFAVSNHFKTHMARHHPGHPIPQLERRKHPRAKNHDETRLLVCKLCGEEFRSKYQMRVHKKKSHFDKSRPYKCHHCDYRTGDKKKQDDHQDEYHKRLGAYIRCHYCGKFFDSRYSILLHFKTKHIDLNLQIPDFINEVRTYRKPKALQCRDCMQEFPNTESLAKHRKTHNKPVESICHHCGKLCKSKNSLNMHVYQRHSLVPKNVPCPECGSTFDTEYKMIVHRGNTHGKGKINFTCSHCGKGFFRAAEYQKHLVVHSDARPFGCSDCEKKFKTKNSLKIHRQNFHEYKEEDRVKCMICDGIFKSDRPLRTHLKRVHKLSLAQALASVGLPYKQRVMWNSSSRTGVFNQETCADVSQEL